MKTLLLALTSCAMILLAADFATAEEVKWHVDSSSLESPLLRKGHIEVGGGLSLGFSDRGETEYEIAPKVEYFVVDRLSLGGFASNSSSKSVNRLTIGPSLTWYFGSFKDSKVFLFANQKLGLQRRETRLSDSPGALVENESLLEGRTSLGAKYFIMKTLALGGAFEYRYNLTKVSHSVSDILTRGFLAFHF